MSETSGGQMHDIGTTYPDETPVVVYGMAMTLGAARQWEEFACTPKNPANRFDPDKRNAFFANVLDAAGSLSDEHRPYLENNEA